MIRSAVLVRSGTAAQLLAVLLLAGCGDQRVASLAPFLGTWHQVDGLDAVPATAKAPTHRGFIAVSADTALIDIDGLPSGSVGIISISGDPAQGSSLLMLANGVRLFIAIGHGTCDFPVPDGHLVGDCAWIDVHAVRTNANGQDESLARLRLWSSSTVAASAMSATALSSAAVASASLPSANRPSGAAATVTPAGAVARTSPPPAPPAAIPQRDVAFTAAVAATGDQQLVAAAQTLLQLHASGDLPVITSTYRGTVLAAQRAVLQELGVALHGDAVALADANRRAAHLDDFSRAYQAWTRNAP
jgi:hypothetical protein